ncbi:BspA family leucine-rich repeat surface protein [Bifidobacterium sp. ESL0775]|uniref:BspA family leucine-rich repeat surface protein n=1 Tax=Bifidobacterium sp. ESL0775 TaxID=2983230 RepID=UPI0023F8001D|nr:BspA family leucine-rich repeat surface protein [Bifidobacterium sp. ESL0775]WEV69483.1 BspA family leucine-rich repeat surface protein [Bifidobacterium sp. ESL0775]
MSIIFHVIATILCTALSFMTPVPATVNQTPGSSASAGADTALPNSPNPSDSRGDQANPQNGRVRTAREVETRGGGQSESSQPEVGPQAVCPQTPQANWGSPYAGYTGVSGQDHSTVKWYIDTSCVLHLSNGTSPDIPTLATSIPWYNQLPSIVGVSVDGNLTLVKSDVDVDLNPAFAQMTKLTSFDTTRGSLHLVESAANGLFDSDTKLTTINGITSWDTSQTTGMASMFYYCSKLTSLNLSGFRTPLLEDTSDMFYNNSALTYVNLTSLSTGNVTSMGEMFYGCSSLASLDLSHFNTADVRSMSSMFYGCVKLNSLDLSNFTTANVTTMNNMFYNCPQLTSLNLSNFVTTSVTNMNGMFTGCVKLDSLDLSNFATAKVTDMNGMFNNCQALTSIKFSSNFKTSRVTDMGGMFDLCLHLVTLDLSGFDTSNCFGNMSSMLPNGLRRLALGPNTKLNNNAFFSVSPTITWEEMSSLDAGADHVGTIGGIAKLQARAASNSPAGVYVDSRLMTYGVKLVVNANGGTTSFAPVTYDTTTAAATITVPQANVLTSNKTSSVFLSWNTCSTGGTTGDCTRYAPGSTISVDQGDSYPVRTLTLYAEWANVPVPVINPPVVHAPVSGNTTVDLTVSNTAAPAGSTTTVTTNRGTWSTETGPGTWNYTGRPVADLEPNPGVNYRINAITTITDPATGNNVSSGNAVKNGVLPYIKLTFNANGGTGAPASMSGFGDADNGRATAFTIPTNTIPTKGQHDMFAGWATSSTATVPNATYNPGNHIPTEVNYANRSVTLYAVWHTAQTPIITEAHRVPSTNQIRITGTGQPWSFVGSPTVSGSAPRGLKVTSAAVSPNGQLSITGTATAAGELGGNVVTVRVRSCPTSAGAPPFNTSWGSSDNSVGNGCSQVTATPALPYKPSFPTWLKGVNAEWSANLNIGTNRYLWVYSQFQGSDGIDGPLAVTPNAQGSDNTMRVCVKPSESAASAYICGNATWDPSSAAWDGTTSHNWTLDLPHDSTLDHVGNYDVKANLNIDDTWRTPAGGIVSSQDATLMGTRISGLYASSLPLTGGSSRRLAIILAAIAGSSLILLAGGADFRHRPRRRFRRH